jgi:hypothetical protein
MFVSTIENLLETMRKQLMLAQYRVARDMGHSIVASLAFALFGRPLGSGSHEAMMRKFLERVTELEKRSHE